MGASSICQKIFMNDSQINFIAKISTAFVKRFRVTILALLAILFVGFYSYTTLLKREGFPEIAYPVVFVQAQHVAPNVATMDKEVTSPIEDSLGNIDEIERVDSNTLPGYSSFVVSFQADQTPDEGADKINAEFAKNLNLPADTKLNVLPFKPVWDGKHEFFLALTATGDSTKELQKKADFVAEELDNLDETKEAETIDLISDVTHTQTTFNRVGQRTGDGEIIFSNSILVGVEKNKRYSDEELSKAIRSKLDQLTENEKLSGTDVVYVADIAEEVDTQISSLQSNALEAMIAVVLVLLLFVNWRASIVTAIFIPTVLAATFISLFVIGYSLNIIVLFALILVLGLFVDDGTVVVETIDYHKKKGVKGIEAIKQGVHAVGVADVAGTVSTALAFSPMIAISGILGEFITPIPITVILALLLSLIIALTLIPFLAYVLIPDKKEKKNQNKIVAGLDLLFNGFSRGVIKFGEKVSKFVGFYLSKWYLTLLVIIISFGLVIFGGYFSRQLKFSVFPPQKDSLGMTITITYPNGLSVAQKMKTAEAVETTLLDNYESSIEDVSYPVVGINQFGQDIAIMDINFVDRSKREFTSVKIADDLDQKLDEFEKNGITIVAEEEQTGGPTEEFSYNMQIYSTDQTKLAAASQDIATFIENLDLERDNKVLATRISYLDSYAKKDGARYVQVSAKLSDVTNSGSLVEIDDKIKKEYDNDKLAQFGLVEESLGFDKGVESDNLEAFASTGLALLIALVLMYALLLVQFDSFLQPLLIFVAIPFSFPLLFPGLYLTDNPLSFFVMIGVIALMGIVVNNTIMLLDFAKRNCNKD